MIRPRDHQNILLSGPDITLHLTGGKVGRLVIRRSLVRIPGSRSCMSKHPEDTEP